MSERTTPAWLSTLGPFEPSPGNGPAVSSGTLLQAPAIGGVVAVMVGVVVAEVAARQECGRSVDARGY